MSWRCSLRGAVAVAASSGICCCLMLVGCLYSRLGCLACMVGCGGYFGLGAWSGSQQRKPGLGVCQAVQHHCGPPGCCSAQLAGTLLHTSPIWRTACSVLSSQSPRVWLLLGQRRCAWHAGPQGLKELQPVFWLLLPAQKTGCFVVAVVDAAAAIHLAYGTVGVWAAQPLRHIGPMCACRPPDHELLMVTPQS